MLHNNSGNLTHWNFPYQGKSVKIKLSPPIEIQWYRRLFHFRLTITTTTILKVFIWTDNQLNAPTKIEGQVTWLTTLLHAQLNSMHQTVRLCISYLLRDKLLSKLWLNRWNLWAQVPNHWSYPNVQTRQNKLLKRFCLNVRIFQVRTYVCYHKFGFDVWFLLSTFSCSLQIQSHLLKFGFVLSFIMTDTCGITTFIWDACVNFVLCGIIDGLSPFVGRSKSS